jgi:hypothetical protein
MMYMKPFFVKLEKRSCLNNETLSSDYTVLQLVVVNLLCMFFLGND